MNVKKEVYEFCKKKLEGEISGAQVSLRRNKFEINRLAKEQRLLKSQIGVFFGLLRTLKK
jgi:hypothetical protein